MDNLISDETAKNGYVSQVHVAAAFLELFKSDDRFTEVALVDSDTHGGPAGTNQHPFPPVFLDKCLAQNLALE